jgi:hypothetical protein
MNSAIGKVARSAINDFPDDSSEKMRAFNERLASAIRNANRSTALKKCNG